MFNGKAAYLPRTFTKIVLRESNSGTCTPLRLAITEKCQGLVWANSRPGFGKCNTYLRRPRRLLRQVRCTLPLRKRQRRTMTRWPPREPEMSSSCNSRRMLPERGTFPITTFRRLITALYGVRNIYQYSEYWQLLLDPLRLPFPIPHTQYERLTLSC